MSSPTAPDGGAKGAGSGANRLDNGLRAPAYVPLTDVETAVGRHLLTALGRARIAAYLSPDADRELHRLFVASEERADARTIVAAAVRALGGPSPDLPDAAPDPLAGVDTDSAFEALVADWHVDTHVAIRDAERELTREDEDWRTRVNQQPAQDPIWLDDDHYVPPPPPPLPRLSAPTVLAIVIMVVAIVLLALGNRIGLPGNFAVVLGICGLLLGGGILVSRLHEHRRNEDDDGAAV